MGIYDTSLYPKENARQVCLEHDMFSFEGNSSPWEKIDYTTSQNFSTTLAPRDKILPVISFSSRTKSNLQKELENCQHEKKLLEDQLDVLRKALEHNICPICQRVFSDRETSIRVKCGKRPVFKVFFANNIYFATWRNIQLGCSICRDGLIEEVNQTFIFLWNEYAKDTTSLMTASALRIKKLMQYFFEEI